MGCMSVLSLLIQERSCTVGLGTRSKSSPCLSRRNVKALSETMFIKKIREDLQLLEMKMLTRRGKIAGRSSAAAYGQANFNSKNAEPQARKIIS